VRVSVDGACAKLRKETNWAGVVLVGRRAWRWLETHVWRRGQVRFSLAAGRGEGRQSEAASM
jgi:hypothetical protein